MKHLLVIYTDEEKILPKQIIILHAENMYVNFHIY